MTWQDDERKSRKFDPQVREIALGYLPKGTPLLRRIRFGGTAAKYGDEFTFRLLRASGGTGEWTSVLTGQWSHYFYGHASVDETRIERWTLVDLGIFRQHQTCVRPERIPTNDGSSDFLVFEFDSFPRALIVAQSERTGHETQYEKWQRRRDEKLAAEAAQRAESQRAADMIAAVIELDETAL